MKKPPKPQPTATGARKAGHRPPKVKGLENIAGAQKRSAAARSDQRPVTLWKAPWENGPKRGGTS